MVGIVAFVAAHDSPQNPCVLVGQGYRSFLPATAFAQSLHPLRDGVVVMLTGQQGNRI